MPRHSLQCAAGLLLCLLMGQLARAKMPFPAGKIARVEVYPNPIQLASPRQRVQLVVTAVLTNGQTSDVTRIAKYSSAGESAVVLDRGVVAPRSDGATEIMITLGDHVVNVPATVTGQEDRDPIRFRHEALAVVTKQGCNAGSCHGSPQGKGGFSLSLFAYDPEFDERSLVRDGLNRRTNVYDPDESLLLKKPMLRLPHVGGKKIRKTDAAYDILRAWIHEGARGDGDDVPECDRIVIYPGPARILRAPHLEQQLSVLAHFQDGTVRDVTQIATYDTSDNEKATVSTDGLVTGHARGQAAITVGFLEHLESVYFTVVRDLPGFEWAAVPEHNFIDKLVNERLKLLQYAPAPTAGDPVFLRRIYLDLTGLLPSNSAVRKFVEDESPNKRDRVIDQLLDSPEFARFQALRLADLLHVRPDPLEEDRAELYAQWIVDAVGTNMPFDELANRLLTASGDTRTVAEANYFAALGATEAVAEATAQLFMGSRIQCAKCHNHPFENWTQNDYYRIAAVFHRVEQKEGVISMAGTGEMTNPTSGKVMQPWGSETDIPTDGASVGDDRRRVFAKWLTAPDNPFFARVEVNRIWQSMLGRGIVEPIDDFRSSNPPANVALLDALADTFVRSRYDRRQMFRLIAESQTYQRTTATSPWNELDDTLFSHARVRRLTAEQLDDAIGCATGTLPPADDFAASLERTRQELETAQAELSAAQPDWEVEQRQRLAEVPYRHGDWWSAAPYEATDADAAHQMAFPPEENLAIDVDEPFDGGRSWQPQPEYQPDTQIDLPLQKPSATYVLHDVWVTQSAQARLTLVADDGMKVWHNRKLVFDRPQITEDAATRVSEIELSEGRNRFLLKISNRTGACHFRFSLEHLGDGADVLRELPRNIVAILGKDDGQWTTEDRALLENFYLESDDRVRRLQERLARGHRQYATGRPYPEESEFLAAFGQPQRDTTCACERSNDPTLDQALQLLNGEEVYQQVQESVKCYGEMPDAQLIEELYLAALARPPLDQERDAAGEHLARAADRQAAVRDLVWAVINTQEFMFQH